MKHEVEGSGWIQEPYRTVVIDEGLQSDGPIRALIAGISEVSHGVNTPWRPHGFLAYSEATKTNCKTKAPKFGDLTTNICDKSRSAGKSRLPRVFSNPTPVVSTRFQKGLIVMIGFIVFLSCLWMFNPPD